MVVTTLLLIFLRNKMRMERSNLLLVSVVLIQLILVIYNTFVMETKLLFLSKYHTSFSVASLFSHLQYTVYYNYNLLLLFSLFSPLTFLYTFTAVYFCVHATCVNAKNGTSLGNNLGSYTTIAFFRSLPIEILEIRIPPQHVSIETASSIQWHHSYPEEIKRLGKM